MIEMIFHDCEDNPVLSLGLLILKEKEGNRFLAAKSETEVNLGGGLFGTDLSLAGMPQTIDAVMKITEGLRVKVSHIVITDIKDNILFVNLVLKNDNWEEIPINFDPVTAVLLCHFGDLPILVPEEILDNRGMGWDREKNTLVPLESAEGMSEEEIIRFQNTPFGQLISTFNLDDFKS